MKFSAIVRKLALMATKSTITHKHCAAIVYHGRILATAINTCEAHAEAAVVKRFKLRGGYEEE